MTYPNIFDAKNVQTYINRLNKLTPTTEHLRGKMTVDQMLAHVNVAYETVYTDKHPKPNRFMKFIIRLFAKKTVVGPKPFKKNSPTAPIFKIEGAKNFEEEKKILIEYLNKTQKLGSSYFDMKENMSFGKLSKEEWNVLFSKHLDHHLQQFGV